MRIRLRSRWSSGDLEVPEEVCESLQVVLEAAVAPGGSGAARRGRIAAVRRDHPDFSACWTTDPQWPHDDEILVVVAVPRTINGRRGNTRLGLTPRAYVDLREALRLGEPEVTLG